MSLNSVKKLIFVMERRCVFSEVRTEFLLNVVQINVMLPMVKCSHPVFFVYQTSISYEKLDLKQKNCENIVIKI
jgi:hypothetical protein